MIENTQILLSFSASSELDFPQPNIQPHPNHSHHSPTLPSSQLSRDFRKTVKKQKRERRKNRKGEENKKRKVRKDLINKRSVELNAMMQTEDFDSGMFRIQPTYEQAIQFNKSDLLQHQNGSNFYLLNSLNSLTISNGLIYDLLNLPTISPSSCRCIHSKCQAGYCQCFSKGLKCRPFCQCVNCLNQVSPVRESVVIKKCRCTKSGCQKKYCECFKEGRLCGGMCECVGCGNCQRGRFSG